MEQVIGEFNVGFIDLVDQQNDFFIRVKRLPQFAFANVVGHIMHALFAQLAVAQAADGVVFIKTLLGACGGLDVPFNHPQPKRRGHLFCQFCFACAGFAFHQQWTLQRYSRVNGNC